jgi:CheY-like chemotaxis protein
MDAPPDKAAAPDRRSYDEQLRVLVVDDDPDTVNTLAFILRDEGYVVQPVYSGDEAVSRVRVFRPDVIIQDIAVPGISGYAVAQAIRYSFPDVRRPLMIAISGIWKQLPDRKVAEQMGFDEYLTKPCDPKALLRLLDDFRRARARRI